MKNNSGLLYFSCSTCYNEQRSPDGTSCRSHCGTTSPQGAGSFTAVLTQVVATPVNRAGRRAL